MACAAIGIAQALQPHVATRTTVVSPAVDVGFEAVLFMVRALTTHAQLRYTVAGVAGAVAIQGAIFPDSACTADAAAAVDVGFDAVFLLVRTLTTHANVRCSIAGVAGTIGIELATLV
jgi:uncharacterized protein YhbP (UPF0306 family)